MSAPQLRTRKPTGKVPYPLILVEGEEKSGKTWAAALLSRSPRVGPMYWMDLGEGAGDEYAAIPGVDYELVDLNGTWEDLQEQVLAARAAAAEARSKGEPPVVLVIDTATDIWTGLKNWVDARYKKSNAYARAEAKDPGGEHKPSQNLWNDANARHRWLMTKLMTFPGIVIMTARGKEVSEVKGGQIVAGSKVWSVDAQKDVPFDVTVWVRMFRDDKPIVVGARSVHAGVRPGYDKPRVIEQAHENLLDWLIFEVLKVDPETADVRDLKRTTADELLEHEKPQAQQAPEDDRRGQQSRGPRPPRPRQPEGQPATAQPDPDRPLPPEVQALVDYARTANDTEALKAKYREAGPLLALDVQALLTDDDRHFLPPAVQGKGVPLGTWLITCGQHIGTQGMSIKDAIAADLSREQESLA